MDDSIRLLLSDPSSEVFVSVTSVWEIAIKSRLGKLVPSIGVGDLGILLRSLNFEVLPIEEWHVIADIGTEPLTRDPFDRLLLGVCAAEGMQLLTGDKVLRTHPLAWPAVPLVKE